VAIDAIGRGGVRPGAARAGRAWLRRAAACLSLAWLVVACSDQSPEALVASARGYAQKGDHNAAVIQLKNALQRAPGSAEARFLLGRSLLEVHDPAAAEKELRRALDLKYPDTQVVPLLARSLYELRQFDTLVKEFGSKVQDDAAVESRVKTYVGEAQLGRGRPLEAANAFAQALKATPGYAPARLGQVRLALAEGRLDDAVALADAVIAAAPKMAEAYVLKAEARLAAGNRDGAKALLQNALQADPDALAAHFALIAVLLDESAFDRAAEQLDVARRKARGDLRVAYFDGLIAYRRGNLPKAREHVQQVLRYAPEHVPSLVLAGAIDLQSGQTSSSEDHLRRALARAPTHAGARRLLVAALLRSAQPARALEALQPLVSSGVEDVPGMAMLAGETYLANGDLARAAAYFEQASKVDGQGVAARTRLGQIALARGQSELGLRELEAAAQADPNQNQADIALVLNHLRNKDLARALAAARTLAKKQPQNPVSFQVLGGVQLMQKDRAAARASFERALELMPTFQPAAFSLVELDLGDKKPDVARRRLAALLEKDPKNEQIMIAQAELEFRAGSPRREVTELLQRAVAANPQSSNARLALVNHHLRDRDPRAALAAAQDAAAALPRDARVIETLALAQEAAGEPNLAIDSLNRLIQLKPGLPDPLLRLAALHTRQRNFDRAIETLQRAQKVAPENRQIDRDLVGMMLNQGKPELALKQTRDLQARAPKYAGGYVLEGDVHLTQKRYAEAERAYRQALQLEPASGGIAGKLITAQYADGKTREADALAARWIADHPRDTAVRLLQANRAMRARDLTLAASHYKALLAVDPDNVVALNNLAWIGGETGDPGALAYAERAAKLAPQSASVLDTLGMLLVKRGDARRGVEVLNRASELAPARFDLRLNFARALVSAGDKDAARRQLQQIVDAKENPPEKRAAAELLQTL
jgi:putative PEP-CTERM system TPR-repeat lipoprotein